MRFSRTRGTMAGFSMTTHSSRTLRTMMSGVMKRVSDAPKRQPGRGSRWRMQSTARSTSAVDAPSVARNAADVARCHAIKTFFDNARGQGVHRSPAAVLELAQLQQQALPEIARCDTRRLERLDQAQRDGEFVIVGRRLETGQRLEFLEADPQVTVVIECFDDRRHHHAVALGRGQQLHLRAKVVAQRCIDGRQLGVVEI